MIAITVDRVRLIQAMMSLLAEQPAALELPDALCAACVSALPVDGVGVSLMSNGHPDQPALLGASDTAGVQIEQLQFDLGEGPCISAVKDARPVLVSDVQGGDAGARWPMFSHAIADLPVRAVFAFPLAVGAIGLGVLACHRGRMGRLAGITDALIMADVVTVALLNYQAGIGADRDGDGVELFDLSWCNHVEVHQASGWLAAALDIPVIDALARLRGYAFCHSRPLRSVATDILAGELHLPADDI